MNPAIAAPSAAHTSLAVAAEGAALLTVAGLLGFFTGFFTFSQLRDAVTAEDVIRIVAALSLAYLVARVAGLLVQGALRRRESRALAADSTLIGRRIAEKLSHRSE